MKKVDLKKPKNGDLKVWWIPQIPMKTFEYPVSSPQEGFILLDALAKYDLFQLENNIKPDFSNVGGLSVYEEAIDDLDEDYDGWGNWYCEFSGEDMDYYVYKENGLELLNIDLKAE